MIASGLHTDLRESTAETAPRSMDLLAQHRRGYPEHGTITGVTDETRSTEWLTIPDLVEILDLTQSRVRRLIEDHHLLAIRRDGVLSVPGEFIRDGEPLGELRGTIIVLQDAGFSSDDALEWLLAEDDSLGVAPIEALRAGRKTEVRRIAQALA